MSLIYRAIWQDDAGGIHGRALNAFSWWVGAHHPGDRSFEVGIEEAINQSTTLVRAGEGDTGSIQRCTLHVDDGTDRIATTLITTAPINDEGSIWVDVERVSRRAFAQVRVPAPALSTRLIARGVRPRRGPVPLAIKPRALRPGEIPDFVNLLARPDRDLPIVVFARDPEQPPTETLQHAEFAAQVLAGSAAVYLVGPAGQVHLTELLGAELTTDPGGARVYLPGVTPGEPTPSRHRRIDAERVARDPRAVPHTIIQLLAPAIAARRSPAEYPVLRRTLDADTDALRDERDEYAARVADLERRLSVADAQLLDLLAELEDTEGQVNLLQAALAQVEASGASGSATSIGGPPPDVDGVAAAARNTQTFLTGIILPDAACRGLAELDQTIEAGTWGRAAWRGFRALDAFARDTEFGPGFWEWCRASRSPFSWPASPKKLAMRESETVMTNESLRAKRLFPIDPALSASGRIEMQAHLKIAEGGNHLIPRIYFYDDRHGPTGKVHIGFFGPHRYVPNTLT